MKRLMYSGNGLLVLCWPFVAFNMGVQCIAAGARVDLTEQKLFQPFRWYGANSRRCWTNPFKTLYFFFSDRASKDMVILRNYARRVEELLKEYERVAGARIKAADHRSQPSRKRRGDRAV